MSKVIPINRAAAVIALTAPPKQDSPSLYPRYTRDELANENILESVSTFFSRAESLGDDFENLKYWLGRELIALWIRDSKRALPRGKYQPAMLMLGRLLFECSAVVNFLANLRPVEDTRGEEASGYMHVLLWSEERLDRLSDSDGNNQCETILREIEMT